MIFSFAMNFLIFFGIYSAPSYQNISYCYHSHTKLSKDFLLIYTHQDLLHMPQPLF